MKCPPLWMCQLYALFYYGMACKFFLVVHFFLCWFNQFDIFFWQGLFAWIWNYSMRKFSRWCGCEIRKTLLIQLFFRVASLQIKWVLESDVRLGLFSFFFYFSHLPQRKTLPFFCIEWNASLIA